MSDKKPGLVMLGFDGGTWSVVNVMLEKGYLPNIRKIIENGVYAKLRTPIPPSTPIIWTTIFTGADKEKHGIRNFFDTAKNIKVPRIWDILLHYGRTAGVVGNYFTYPINQKLSFCIPSHFDPGIDTHPPRYSFLRWMTRAIEGKNYSYGIFVKNGFSALRNGLRFRSILFAVRSILGVTFNRVYLNSYHRFQRMFMDISLDVFLHAYRKTRTDFAAFYTPLPDTISHKYWVFHEPENFEKVDPKLTKKYGRIICDTYRHFDRRIGDVLKTAPPDTQICVVSDHGFRAMEDPYDRIVVVPEKLINFLDLKGEVVITNLGHQIIVQPKTKELTEKLLKIFQEAYVSDIKRPVFLFFDVDSETNTVRFQVNHSKIRKVGTKIIIDSKEIKTGEIARVGSTWTGNHDTEDGLFMLSGNGVINNGEKEMIDAVDISPTLLRLQGIDITKCSDGKVREDMIDKDWAEENPAVVIESYDNISFKPDQDSEVFDDEIAGKLKSLGYM